MAFRKENIHLIPNWFRSSCSQMVFFKIQVKTSLLKWLFNNVAGLKAWNFIKKRLWHRYFPVNFPQFFNKPYLKNTSKWLLLLIPPFQPNFACFFLHFFLLLLIIAMIGFYSESVWKWRLPRQFSFGKKALTFAECWGKFQRLIFKLGIKNWVLKVISRYYIV